MSWVKKVIGDTVMSVVDDTSHSHDGGRYTGRLVEGRRDGWGVCRWPDGNTYDGEWSHGARQGRGVHVWPDGGTYDGEWHKNLCDGWGTRAHAGAGWRYEGLMRSDQWKVGTWHSPDGVDVQHGTWAWNETKKANEMQGWGVQRRRNGSADEMETVYEGQWEGGKWHGWGTWRSPSHSGDMFHGQFDHGKMSGYGRMLFGGKSEGVGGSYVGEWKDDMFHGRGVRTWDDGTKYKGEWVYGNEHGSGTKTWARDGTSFEGVWDTGAIVCGTKRWPNGDEFAGTFTVDGVGEGKAIFKKNNLEEFHQFEGTLKNNVFQATVGISCQMGAGDLQMADKVRKLETTINSLKQELLEVKRKLAKQTECGFEHTLKHIQRGVWVKSIAPNKRYKETQRSTPEEEWGGCVMRPISVTLERHNIADSKLICSLCPLEKVVKMEIETKFAVDESQQVVSFPTTGEHSGWRAGISPSLAPFLSMFPLEAVPEIKVTLTPVMDIPESDLAFMCSLGSGSYGTVSKCTHIPSKRIVAAKTLHDVLVMEDSKVEKFMLEAEIVSGLRHPNIVKCIGTTITTSRRLHMIVSELMCCSLRQLLQTKQLSFKEVTSIALNVSQGMDSLHRLNYMHRDLSSNNVLFDSDGTPKICDFGVSRAMDPHGTQRNNDMTKDPGTLLYMSPQMFTTHYSIEGDMWSFGILMTEMMNGGIVQPKLWSLPLNKYPTFMAEQKRMLLKPEIEEVNRLCYESSETIVANCLSRRSDSLDAVNTLTHSCDSPMRQDGTAIPKTAADLMYSVVESCLSILERDRFPFTVIVKLLFSVCTCVAIASQTSTEAPVTDDQVKDSISDWLFSLSTSVHLVSPAPPCTIGTGEI
ncbi:MORN motif protein [Pelomyxa schiedti]|nr:MORN motif protein [Pelomyxa schiedti]